MAELSEKLVVPTGIDQIKSIGGKKIMFEYYLLSDSQYSGLIVRKNKSTRAEFYYDKIKNKWLSIGIMNRYFWPESDQFEMYKEITEQEVLEAIK
ncbi:hypothetical protein P7D46_10770 [Enterococcus dongliensis]|nr:hypothetical protein [Enterococcus dongliensis]